MGWEPELDAYKELPPYEPIGMRRIWGTDEWIPTAEWERRYNLIWGTNNETEGAT